MSKRYSGKSFKDRSVMKKPKLTSKEKRKLKEEKKKKRWKFVLAKVFNHHLKMHAMFIIQEKYQSIKNEKISSNLGSGFVGLHKY